MSSEFPLNIEPKADSPARIEQLQGVDPRLYTTASEFNKIIRALGELDGRYLPVLSEIIADMAQIDMTQLNAVKNKNRVIPVAASRNLQVTDNDAILMVLADVTLTITELLQDDFSCNIYVRGAYTATLEPDTETYHAPDGLEVTEDQMALIFKNGDEFIIKI
jgi:hypothetical protein